MSPADLIRRVRAQPFEPFKLHLSDGSSFKIPHPDFITVSRKTVYVAVDPGRDDVPEKVIWCDPLHITRLEPLTNGSRKRTAA
jgi:hypothetical protein